jgi:RimJ/RimL family protein N-acetyltransferase
MLEEVKVRKATKNDLETLYQFEQGVIAAERPFDPTLKEDPVHYYSLEEMLSASHIHLVVAEIRGKIISCGYGRIEEAKHFVRHQQHVYLGFMYTLPEYRGKGINQEIIKELTRWAASKNISEIQLEVYFENQPAIKAYEKVGFRKHMIVMRTAINKTGSQ